MQYSCVNMVRAKEFCAIVTKSNRVELRSAQWSESRSCSAPQERTSGSENYPWWQSTLFNELRTLHSVCNTHGIISQLCNTLHGTERAPLCIVPSSEKTFSSLVWVALSWNAVYLTKMPDAVHLKFSANSGGASAAYVEEIPGDLISHFNYYRRGSSQRH